MCSSNDTVSLKDQLESLRISSKGAVVDGNSALNDPIKRYLHIDRDVDSKFYRLVTNASERNESQLILLIGNVGDGKSHLLANLKRKDPGLLNNFIIHNDATASFRKNQTYIDALDELLRPFSDNNGNTITTKIILAINLGTLANFLEAKGAEYTAFKKYISTKGIFAESLEDSPNFENCSSFQHINLTDYHLFSLTKDGPVSTIIESLIQRITNESNENPFYQAYKNYYIDKSWAANCPVKFNFEFLMKDDVKIRLCKIITEAIIRGKMVVSIRALLNFLFDAIVPVKLANLSSGKYEAKISNISQSEYLSMLMPNYIFENPDISNLFFSLHKLDPLINCSEEDDQLLLGITGNKNAFGIKIVEENQILKKSLEDSNLDTELKTIPRLFFFEKGSGFTPSFEEYSRQLYFFHKGERAYIKKLYEGTVFSIRQWNGIAGTHSDSILLSEVSNGKYKISTSVTLSLNPNKIKSCAEEPISKFNLFLPLYFKEIKTPLKIDYALYYLLQKIKRGYIPNHLDKRNHVNVQQFLELIIAETSDRRSIVIETVCPSQNVEYTLSLDEFDEFVFEEKH